MPDLVLTRDQVRRIDALAVEEYHMPSVVLMENAGRNAAQIINRQYADLAEKRVVIFCGPGNNGGDGFCVARHLHNAGWDVRVILAVPEQNLKGDALTNYKIIRETTICVEPPTSARRALDWSGIIVDGLLGTGFTGQVRKPLDQLIDQINASGKPIVAVDVPSGLDCQSGQPADSTIRAAMTVSFVAVKSAMTGRQAMRYVGRVITADIGVPIELVRRISGSGER